MITITIECKDNKLKLKTEGYGEDSDVIKEATFLIDHTVDIYKTVVDQLPPSAQLHVLVNALYNLTEEKDE